MNASTSDIARAIIDSSLYMVLATADASGRPWASPVYFAHADYRAFLWVSSPEATHSRNLVVRAQIGIAIFDSHAAIGSGQGFYIGGVAKLIDGAEADQAIDVFSARSREHGGATWTREDIRSEADMRLYRAVADDYWILARDGRPDHRIAVPSIDHPGAVK